MGTFLRQCPPIIVALIVGAPLVFADAPKGYYDLAYGKKGPELREQIHTIIDGHKVIPYTVSGNTNWFDGQDMDVWEALAYTDSVCAPEYPDCGIIKLLYLDEYRHVSQANRGDSKNDSWDREHVWPKSRGFPNQNQVGYTDLHHLRPADRNLNGAHSNYGYDNGGEPVIDKRNDGSEILIEARLNTNEASFEPPNRAKGQVARILFYMAIRYEEGDNGADELMPDLVLKDTNSKVNEPWIGDLCTLLEWHNQYGPTNFERQRNDKVMEIQGNRNPFIDEPGWANLIWQDQCE